MADQVKAQLSNIRAKLQHPVLDQLEKKYNVPREYVAVGVGAVLLLFLLFSNGAGLLCNVIGFAFPAYYSFKAIESPNKDDDKQWLVYWVVYSFFTIIETFVSIILYWIPFYFAFKLAFLVFLGHPQWKGAVTIYDSFLKGLLLKAEGAIDSQVDSAKKAFDAGKQVAGEKATSAKIE